ncbi:unnamed protein product, partial [Effrenium voratum]
HGVSAVDDFLQASWCRRVVLLFPSLHPWVTLFCYCMFSSARVRVALVTLKLVSAAAGNALFYGSEGETSDECAEPSTLLSQVVQQTTVGFVSACMGDVVVLFFFLMQKKRVTRQASISMTRRLWLCRTVLFWVLWFLYMMILTLYVMLFLANFGTVDSERWMHATLVSLMQ